MRAHAQIVFALLAAATFGCAGRNKTETGTTTASSSEDAAVVEVVNRSSNDMDIYLNRNGQRTRVGFAPADKTTSFKLPHAETVGVGMTVLEAHPTRGGQVIQSDPVSFVPGSVVTFPIPPQ